MGGTHINIMKLPTARMRRLVFVHSNIAPDLLHCPVSSTADLVCSNTSSTLQSLAEEVPLNGADGMVNIGRKGYQR
jgi:hypothetical protein